MKAITEGAAKWQEKKWFPELVDKRMNSNALHLQCYVNNNLCKQVEVSKHICIGR